MSSSPAPSSFADEASSRLSSLLGGLPRRESDALVKSAMGALGIDRSAPAVSADAAVGVGPSSASRMEAVLEIAVSAHFSHVSAEVGGNGGDHPPVSSSPGPPSPSRRGGSPAVGMTAVSASSSGRGTRGRSGGGGGVGGGGRDGGKSDPSSGGGGGGGRVRQGTASPCRVAGTSTKRGPPRAGTATQRTLTDMFLGKRKRVRGASPCSGSGGDGSDDDHGLGTRMERPRNGDDCDDGGSENGGMACASVSFAVDIGVDKERAPDGSGARVGEGRAHRSDDSNDSAVVERSGLDRDGSLGDRRSGVASTVERHRSARAGKPEREPPPPVMEGGAAVDVDFLASDFDAVHLAEQYRRRGSGEFSPPFRHLAKALTQVCSTTKRLEKERVLTNLLLAFLYYDRMERDEIDGADRKTVKDDSAVELFGRSCVLHAVLLAGNVACNGLVLNVGGSAISQAICSALSCSATRLRQRVGVAGELGDAAADIMSGNDSCSMAPGSGRYKQQTRLAWGTKPKPLRIYDVVNAIAGIHIMGKGGGGKGIDAKRKACLFKLFAAAQHHEELRFVVKIFCMHIRTGATLITVLRSLSGAHVLHSYGARSADWVQGEKPDAGKTEKNESGAKADSFVGVNMKEEISAAQEKFRAAYALHHDLKACVLAFVNRGFEGLKGLNVEAGVPLQPMLAAPSRGVDDVISHYFEHFSGLEIGKEEECSPFFTAEYKYDGQRAQIHCCRNGKSSRGGPSVQIFSRHLDDMTEKFGALVEWMKNRAWPKSFDSFILDAEICAVRQVKDSDEVAILPFQVLSTMRRGAEHGDTSAASESGPDASVCVFAFDLIFFNGKSLVNESFRDRRIMMKDVLRNVVEAGRFEFAKSIDVIFSLDGRSEDDTTAAALSRVDEFLREAIGPGRCEGLMLKSLHSLYTSHETREKSGGFGGWRKLKKDYIDSLADSIDVVPIGGWRGNGRKSKWFSPYLLAVYNPDTGEFQSLCRCMSGFSDEFYQESYDFYASRIVEEMPDNVSTDEHPSFWFQPTEVWEIRGADLTLSPVHHAAKGLLDGSCDVDFDEPRGVSLRFPRFIRPRPDKSIEDATTHHQILNLFTKQAQRQNA